MRNARSVTPWLTTAREGSIASVYKLLRSRTMEREKRNKEITLTDEIADVVLLVVSVEVAERLVHPLTHVKSRLATAHTSRSSTSCRV